ncbi:nucleotidyltransferase [Pasteurellaceae bacterium RH1A]|nr:nucleotidyltransferase [Pasteurellaceae bacterium RH1A]
MLTIQDLQDQNLILFEAISGSRAYGLATPQSDTDIRGVFYLPQADFYGLNYIPQVANETNDIVYYELGRFVELLLQSNPTVLELLSSPPDCIRIKDPIMDLFNPSWFISKACHLSFAGYALGQIKKAQGLNKKMVNPVEKVKKSVLDFCYVIDNGKSIALQKWLIKHQFQQENIGLAKVNHAKNTFSLFYDSTGHSGYHGVMQKENANSICLSNIPSSAPVVAYLSFNQDGYSAYCKDYTEYWQWMEKRNPARYAHQAQGQTYDTKNMMHTFRLLEMARDIAWYGEIRVRRPNREALLAIKAGQFIYDDLLVRAESLAGEVERAFNQSNLSEQVNRNLALQALVEARLSVYK